MDATWFNVPENMQHRIVSWGVKDSTGIQENPRLPEATATTFSGGGGLYGSPKDYLTFLTCLINYGEYDGGQLLKKETVELMLEDNLPEDVNLRYDVFENNVMSHAGTFGDESDRWGLAWALESNEDERIRPQGVAYWAGAANTYYTLDPENGTAIVYFTQYFPFNDKTSYDFYRLYEQTVYDGMP